MKCIQLHGISRIIAKMFVSDADSANQTCYYNPYAYCFAIKKNLVIQRRLPDHSEFYIKSDTFEKLTFNYAFVL